MVHIDNFGSDVNSHSCTLCQLIFCRFFPYGLILSGGSLISKEEKKKKASHEPSIPMFIKKGGVLLMYNNSQQMLTLRWVAEGSTCSRTFSHWFGATETHLVLSSIIHPTVIHDCHSLIEDHNINELQKWVQELTEKCLIMIGSDEKHTAVLAPLWQNLKMVWSW